MVKRLGILAGSPGTGKTFSFAALIKSILSRGVPRDEIAVAAPTGKASVRCTEALHKNGVNIHASTIHSLLSVAQIKDGEFEFEHNERRPLPHRYIFLDEVSMLDTGLAAAFFRSVGHHSNVLLIGDPGQLPPVNHGSPLRDMIAAGVPTGTLSEIHRNSGAIVRACADMKDGKVFECYARVDEDHGVNLVHIQADDEAAQLQAIINILGAMRLRGFDPVWDCQVLCATNEKSAISRKNVNVVLQSYLNSPPASPGDVLPTGGIIHPEFRVRDKVMCLKNCETRLVQLMPEADPSLMGSYRPTLAPVYVANGEVGRVEAVSKSESVVKLASPDRLVKVPAKKKKKEEDGESATSGKVEYALAYGCTIHKFQGSETPVIILVLDKGAGPIGARELLYTGISRASRLCFLVGDLATAYKWASKVNLAKRKTFLVDLITGGGA